MPKIKSDSTNLFEICEGSDVIFAIDQDCKTLIDESRKADVALNFLENVLSRYREMGQDAWKIRSRLTSVLFLLEQIKENLPDDSRLKVENFIENTKSEAY